MPRRLFSRLALALLLALAVAGTVSAQSASPEKSDDELQKLTQESSNPVGSLWMITNQFNLNLLQSPKGGPFKY
jgi:curli biogenesis system outer membrane secretion channel CsgG